MPETTQPTTPSIVSLPNLFSEHAELFASITENTPLELFIEAIKKHAVIDISKNAPEFLWENAKIKQVGEIYFTQTTATPESAMILSADGTKIDMRNELSEMIKTLLDAYKLITNSDDTEIQKRVSSYTIEQFFSEVQAIIDKFFIENEEDSFVGKATEADLLTLKVYAKAIGISELPQEEQDEILKALVRTIHKQFLLDVYKEIGLEKLKALEASAHMGDIFYATTMKHIVPEYESIFLTARQNTINNFTKTKHPEKKKEEDLVQPHKETTTTETVIDEAIKTEVKKPEDIHIEQVAPAHEHQE